MQLGPWFWIIFLLFVLSIGSWFWPSTERWGRGVTLLLAAALFVVLGLKVFGSAVQ
jgi:hypothetical protein